MRIPAFKFRKSALVPTRYLADFFVEDPQEYLINHETMFAKIVEKKSEDQKIAMSAKLKDVASDTSEHAVQLMETLLADLDKIAKVGDEIHAVTRFEFTPSLEGPTEHCKIT